MDLSASSADGETQPVLDPSIRNLDHPKFMPPSSAATDTGTAHDNATIPDITSLLIPVISVSTIYKDP